MVRSLELSLSMYHIVGVEDVSSASNTEKALCKYPIVLFSKSLRSVNYSI